MASARVERKESPSARGAFLYVYQGVGKCEKHCRKSRIESGGWIMEAEGNRSQSILNWLTTDDEASVLRSDARYDVLVGRLKKVAKKP